MPSASMNRLMDNARINLPGALDTSIQAEMFSVVGEFLQRTSAWKAEFDIDVQPVPTAHVNDVDYYTYLISPPTGSGVHFLLSVRDASNFQVSAALQQPNYIVLSRSPDTAQVFKCWVTLTVTDPITRTGEPVVPDWIIDKYNDVLLDGVIGRMMAQAAKPYSSMQLAGERLRSFRTGTSQARIESDRSSRYGGQNWRFPQGFASIRGRR